MVILKQNFDFPNSFLGLPENYNFEVAKTLSTIKKLNAKKITLQFPDGLLSYAPIIIDGIQTHTGADCVILSDVVYGACCVDDDSIKSDLLVHYGHSCLIPITDMNTRALYIFVDIKIDIDHLCDLIVKNFHEKVAIIGTIQFNSSVNKLRVVLNSRQKEIAQVCKKHGDDNSNQWCRQINDTDTACTCVQAIIPQVKPLSPGEVLGCTSPIIRNTENVIYIGDGRFHLESAMIRNPGLNFYKYCPFTRKLTREYYDFNKMKNNREKEIQKAFNGKSFGVILGSLGKQGNKQVFQNVIDKLKSYNKYKIYNIIVDEINQEILSGFDFVDSFVQVSCTRLSTDWGLTYSKPLLSPMEVFYSGEYHMDYYSKEGDAPWKNYNNKINE